MPTENPRVNVTLTPSLDLLVTRLAKHERISKSQVLRELLEAAQPALERAVSTMDAAFRVRQRVLEHVASGMDLAAEQVGGEMHLVLLDAVPDLVSQAEKVQERRPAREGLGAPAQAAAPASNPPASNRGVKSAPRGKTRGPQGPVRASKKGAAS